MIGRTILSLGVLATAVLWVEVGMPFVGLLFAFIAGQGAMTVVVDWSEGKRP